MLLFGQTVNTPTLQRNNQWSGLNQFLGGNYVAKIDLLAQQTNVGPLLLYTTPANGAGMYRISAYVADTQAATTSSTLPAVLISSFTDNDSGISHSTAVFTATGITTNAIGDSSAANTSPANPGTLVINAKASTVINFSTSGYASSGATSLQYSLHIKVEYIGN